MRIAATTSHEERARMSGSQPCPRDSRFKTLLRKGFIQKRKAKMQKNESPGAGTFIFSLFLLNILQELCKKFFFDAVAFLYKFKYCLPAFFHCNSLFLKLLFDNGHRSNCL